MIMDAGNGTFKHFESMEELEAREEFKRSRVKPSIFSKGEILEIKESTFKIVDLNKKYMKLRLLPVKSEEKTHAKE
jgi:hypothetical protein